MEYNAIAIGVSAGGVNALTTLFSLLPKNLSFSIIVVQHISPYSDNKWIDLISSKTNLVVREAEEKEKIERGTIYIAPPNYHLVVELDKTFSLTIDERVNFSRPSVDVLFESAAEVYHEKLIGIILTGSNADGTKGIKKIKDLGGLTIVQDPLTAEVGCMPASAIAAITPDHILSINGIGNLLTNLSHTNQIKTNL